MHHFALLIGYGAAAVNPYLALESIAEMVRDGLLGEMTEREASRKYLKAASKGVLKVMSKMGISTVASYTGAQVFEAIGLDRALVDRYFGATPSRLGGIGLAEIAARGAGAVTATPIDEQPRRASSRSRSGASTSGAAVASTTCSTRRTVFKLQHATRAKRYDVFKEYTQLVDEQSERLATLRGLLRLRIGDDALRPACPSRRSSRSRRS